MLLPFYTITSLLLFPEHSVYTKIRLSTNSTPSASAKLANTRNDMATAYHMEALRRQRVLERKREALHRLLLLDENGKKKASQAQPGGKGETQLGDKGDCSIKERGDGSGIVKRAAVMRSSCSTSGNPQKEQNPVAFEEVVHDSNFQYRILRSTHEAPVHVDPIYRIMYPGAIRHVRKSQLKNFLKKRN